MLVAGLTLFALAASSPDDGDPCAVAGACRHVDSVRVENTDGKAVVLPVDQDLPWVTQGNLLLLPGDWVVVRLVEGEGGLAPMLVAGGHGGAAPEPAEGEVRFVLHDYASGNIMVQVLSRYRVPLDYAALMVTPRGAERTSVCTLQPGVTVIETWQQPIRQFAFWSFRPAQDAACRIIDFPAKDEGPHPET